MLIVRFTTTEGGMWIYPANNLEEEKILSMPLVKNEHGDPIRWGIVHSYIREDGRRFDASNHSDYHGYRKALKNEPRSEEIDVGHDDDYKSFIEGSDFQKESLTAGANETNQL